ncbi:hypothetical protein Tsubulata_046359 [Turnera subulata]|uniref:BHLH domain-containing protein n=1 Tax=Turnera subulata TaxID=218843 RepID=A0A9Q0F4Q0_9ROSI|nr:hypothetical protein Tsubulata_046359 [Turnera subulata]
MVLGANGVLWVGREAAAAADEEEDAVSSWTRNNSNNNNNNNTDVVEHKEVVVGEEEEEGEGIAAMNGSLSTFKSILETTEWYMNAAMNPQEITLFSNQTAPDNLLIDSSSSCSPSQAFALDPSQSHHQQQLQHSFLPLPKQHQQQPCFSSLLSVTNPFDSAYDLGCDAAFLGHFHPNSSTNSLMGLGGGGVEFQATQLLPAADNANTMAGAGFGNLVFEGFEGSSSANSSLLLNRAATTNNNNNKVLRPLEVLPPLGSQPTLFQKRAMLRQGTGEKLGNLEVPGLRYGGDWGEMMERKRKRSGEEGEIEEGSFDVSGLNYDSDDLNNGDSKMEESTRNDGGSNSNANSNVTSGAAADHKGKKKGMPAKNLMAERRRRKKLNDRLYMLRSVVPKISKMDRASILGDAIDYLKELLQRINDLHNELESTPPGALLPPSTSFHPLTPTPTTLPCRVKEELCPGSMPSPKGQSARVEVRVREGRAVNIHMFCARRPGLLLSTMRALDNLGLDIQQAVISCFNGFALDVFRAEQCREGQDVLPEQIKAVLLDSAGFHGMM